MSRQIGIIVDGEGDIASLKKRFKDRYKILRTDGPRGHTASVDDIAKKSRKQISMLQSYDCIRAVIVIDRERRNVSYNSFFRGLEAAFTTIHTEIPVSIAVPDRMIENWYLADIAYLSRKKTFLKNGLRQKNYEGRDGKKEIKKCMRRDIDYRETIHGPQMFEILRFNVARRNSTSFNQFLSVLDITGK